VTTASAATNAHEAAPDAFQKTVQVHLRTEELQAQLPDLLAPMQLWLGRSLGVKEHERLP